MIYENKSLFFRQINLISRDRRYTGKFSSSTCELSVKLICFKIIHTQ